jgi:hypothetical protein
MMNNQRASWLAFAIAIPFLAIPDQVAAASIETASVIERTCKAGATTDPDQLKSRLLGFALSDLGQDVASEDRIDLVKDIYARRGDLTSLSDDDKYIIDFVNQLQNDLVTSDAKPLGSLSELRPAFQAPGSVLADSVRLSCEIEEQRESQADAEPTLRLRESPESLVLNGDDRLTAPAANFGFKRERSFLDDGGKKVDKTITVKAAVGALLTSPKSDEHAAVIYAAYELNRARSKPAAVVVPPATARDGDTELLKLGFVGRSLFELGGENRGPYVDVEIDASYLFDFVDDAERFRASVGLIPSFGKADLGICRIGGLNNKDTAIIPEILGKCTLKGLFQVNHVTKAGTAEYGASDEFVMVGSEAGIELILSGKKESGIIASADYRYLKSIHGQAPNIDRFHAFLGYRHWFAKQWAFDIGADFVDGINPDSFADENIFQLKFGLVF